MKHLAEMWFTRCEASVRYPFTSGSYADVVTDILAILEVEVASLPAGAKIASEHELMARFDATRSTVRRVIEQMESRFLVRRVHGAGTFVNRRVDYLISSALAPSLHTTVECAGASARTFVVDASEQPLPAEIAQRIGFEAGIPCTRLVRLGYIDDDPATCAEEWVLPGVLDHVDVSLRAIESLTEVLRASRRTPVRAWSRVSTEFPPASIAERLELRVPVTTWHLETLTRDGNAGPPLLCSRSWMRQDRMRVVIEFDAPLAPPADLGTGSID